MSDDEYIRIERDRDGKIIHITDSYSPRKYHIERDSENRISSLRGDKDMIREMIGNERGLLEIDIIEKGCNTNIVTINNSFISVNGRVPDENIKKDQFYYDQELAAYFNSLFQRTNDFWTKKLINREITIEEYDRHMDQVK